MKEFQTEQKSNFFMGLICVIGGALVTCALYFGVARLGIFSSWASAVGVTISILGYNHFVKGASRSLRNNLWRIFRSLCYNRERIWNVNV